MELPDDPTPGALTELTVAGQLSWTRRSGDAFEVSGRDRQDRQRAVALTRVGRNFTLTVSDGGKLVGAPEVERSGWFRRCALETLYRAVDYRTPAEDVVSFKGRMDGNRIVIDESQRQAFEAVLAAAPVTAQSGPPRGGDWAPPGRQVKVLDEELSSRARPEHAAVAKRLEEARFGPYTLVAVDARDQPVAMVRYGFRVFLSDGDGRVLLAVSQERFAQEMFGVHRGAAHVNYDAVPAGLTFEAFRLRARDILVEELLGIRAPDP